jgi:hypothetical protein
MGLDDVLYRRASETRRTREQIESDLAFVEKKYLDAGSPITTEERPGIELDMKALRNRMKIRGL